MFIPIQMTKKNISSLIASFSHHLIFLFFFIFSFIKKKIIEVERSQTGIKRTKKTGMKITIGLIKDEATKKTTDPRINLSFIFSYPKSCVMGLRQKSSASSMFWKLLRIFISSFSLLFVNLKRTNLNIAYFIKFVNSRPLTRLRLNEFRDFVDNSDNFLFF